MWLLRSPKRHRKRRKLERLQNNPKRKKLTRSSPVFLVVGLGNPGLQYQHTRHNVGFMVLHRWARALGLRFQNRRFEARSTKVTFQDREVILLCPQTFMNLSGKSVKACADCFGIGSEETLVVHDDLDLSLGRVKVVKDGGDGGHKGIQSIFQHLGTRGFSRVKIGIGRPEGGEPVEEFVLSRFHKKDHATIEEALSKAICACELFVSDGVGKAMNQINRCRSAG